MKQNKSFAPFSSFTIREERRWGPGAINVSIPGVLQNDAKNLKVMLNGKNLQQVPWDYAKYPLSKCNLNVPKEETSNSVMLTNPIHIFQRIEAANFL